MLDHSPYHVDDLDERQLVKAALDAAEEELQSLCAANAGTFVSVERRSRAMEDALKDLLGSIKVVEGEALKAQYALEQDEDKESSLAALSEKHRVRRRTLLQHSSLLELLELPSLMDACVRSDMYEEAISISSFSNTLERRHTDKNEVVSKVIAQIRSRQMDLRRMLLYRLKTQVTMPQCLEVVTALRRLNSIDLERQQEANLERVHTAMELRLQVDFLEARDCWLDSIPSNARGPVIAQNTTEQILDTIERYRTRMFEISTQFNAIFRAQANAIESSMLLLSMWTTRRIQSFLDVLAASLATMDDTGAIRDALEAAAFFATSMGRLGADFTAQLPPLFEPKVHASVVSHWREGVDQLSETLRVCREAGVASPLSTNIDAVSGTAQEIVDLDGPQPPPRQLMAVPPLARLVNSILVGLNELRRCLLPGIFVKLRKAMDDFVNSAHAALKENEKAVLKPGLRGESKELRAAAVQYKEIFDNIVEPYVRGSLEAALGNAEGAVRHHAKLADNLRPEDAVSETPEHEQRAKEGETVQELGNDPTSEDQEDASETDCAEHEEGIEGNKPGTSEEEADLGKDELVHEHNLHEEEQDAEGTEVEEIVEESE